jgi:hypothetical protein
VVVSTLILRKVLVSKANGTEGHGSHLGNDLKHVGLHLIGKRSLLSVLVKVKVAALKDLLSSTLHVTTLIIACFSISIVLCQSGHSLSLGCEMETSEIFWEILFSGVLVIDSEFNHKVQHGNLGCRSLF